MNKKIILIVDDEESLAQMLKMNIELAGYDVIVACDGESGIEKTYKNNPDLVVLDLMLPKMNGYWVCELLKKDKRYSNTPIIILTARVEKEDLALGEMVGADCYLSKPCETEVLLSKIKELLFKN